MELDTSPVHFNDDLILDLLKQEDEGETKDCECLINKAWTINSCTPLNNFSYEENDLKSYGLEIAKFVKMQCNIKSPKCEFEIVPELAFTNIDSKSVKITVFTTENMKRKHLFLGYLVSRDSNLKSKNFIRLPIFLYNGSLKVAAVLCSAIEFLFGASISEVKFSVNELLAFSINYCLKANAKDDDDDKDFILNYALPGHFPNTGNIEYTIESGAYKQLFNRFLEKSRNDTTNVVSCFYDEILMHFFNTYEMNLNFFNLSFITLENNFKIARKGKIKCKNPSVLNTMLKYLTQNINRVQQI